MSGSRLFAIGDIHGCDQALETLLDELEITSDDTVIVLGDLINRGMDSKGVIERLIELSKSCQLIRIKGNHEEMALNVLRDGRGLDLWMEYGGKSTLESYGGSIDKIPEEHVEFLDQCVPYYETDEYVFVHANLEPKVALDQQSSQWLRWQRFKSSQPRWDANRLVICGHTPQKSGLPLMTDGWLCLDTYTYGGMALTATELNSAMLYQSLANGQYRGDFSFEDLKMLTA